MVSHATMNLKIYNMVGIRHFAKLAKTSEGSATNNFKASLTPTQIKLGKNGNNKGMSNHIVRPAFVILC